MKQISMVHAAIRDAAMKRTAGCVEYQRRGRRLCLSCNRWFKGDVGDYWCPTKCFPAVMKSEAKNWNEGRWLHRDEHAPELEGDAAAERAEPEFIDENGRAMKASKLADHYKRELMSRNRGERGPA